MNDERNVSEVYYHWGYHLYHPPLVIGQSMKIHFDLNHLNMYDHSDGFDDDDEEPLQHQLNN